ncbi:tail fiber domain-containing protein [Meiothermus sp.]|uniref:tail fiber domain-containing protein n=1 Tax=Meiothermus sp. TaxID=1955249 RepID=UPI00307CFEF2
MPKTLTPINVFPTTIPNFPLAGNNEPVAIGPLESAIQAVLNRTENLHQSRLVVEGAGIKRIQRVATTTALQNLAGMADQDVVAVDGFGLYQLFNPSGLPADGLWILSATGGGRWVHTSYLMRGINNAWAMLDSGGRLAQDVRDGSIFTQHLANLAVTGAKIANNTISGGKLAAGAAVANIGYNPVNRAGDTMTGNLVNTQRLFVHRQLGAGGPGISLAIGDDDTGFDWASDGAIDVRANGQSVFGWNPGEVTFYADKRLRFDPGARIQLRGYYSTSAADIGTTSAFLGDAFNANYGFIRWYVSSGYPNSVVPGSFEFPGAALGSSHASHIHAQNGRLYFFTTAGVGSSNHLYSVAAIEANAQLQIADHNVVTRARLAPDADNVVTWRLGDSGLRWHSVWAANGTIQTSDARLKTDVEESPLGLEFLRRLRPVRYRWIEGGKEIAHTPPTETQIARTDEEGNEYTETVMVQDAAPTYTSVPGRRLHYGLIAQEVKAVLDDLQVGDFGGWVLDDVSKPDSNQSLRYDQFVAPIIRAIQELAERLERLERRKKAS